MRRRRLRIGNRWAPFDSENGLRDCFCFCHRRITVWVICCNYLFLLIIICIPSAVGLCRHTLLPSSTGCRNMSYFNLTCYGC
jgi:hypothetical protein